MSSHESPPFERIQGARDGRAQRVPYLGGLVDRSVAASRVGGVTHEYANSQSGKSVFQLQIFGAFVFITIHENPPCAI
jgi:hypothetical protein